MTRPADEGAQKGPHLRMFNAITVSVALLLATALFICDAQINAAYVRMERATERYILATQATGDMSAGSDYLTDRARCFAVTGDLTFLRDYFEEADVTRRRDRALESLEDLFGGVNSAAYASLAQALAVSNELMEREYLSMRLVQTAFGHPDAEVPAVISGIVLDPADAALTAQERQAKAQALIFDSEYNTYKAQIMASVRQCTDDLIHETSTEVETATKHLNGLLSLQTALTILLLLTVVLLVVFISTQVRSPLSRMVQRMREKQMIEPRGAEELRFVARTYNTVFEENQKAHANLTFEARHDALTGLFNRRAYDLFIQEIDLSHVALMLIDVDNFKSINDTYGHDGGDLVLQRVAQLMHQNFRSVDILCRIGGDEFAVILTRADSSMANVVRDKITRMNDALQRPENGAPPASLSVGVAFSDRAAPQGDLFKDADTALYRVKQLGRQGCYVYGNDDADGRQNQ